MSGRVEDLLDLYLEGGLEPGTELPVDSGSDLPPMDRMTER
ncbi:MAG: hypothetical protein ABID40_04655 [Candidatus Bipolaricaulota bacterium]